VNSPRPGTLIAIAIALVSVLVVGGGLAAALTVAGPLSVSLALAAIVSFIVTLASGAAAATGFVFVGVFKTSDAFRDPNSPIPTGALVFSLLVCALRNRNGDRYALGWAGAWLPATVVLTFSALFIAGGDAASTAKLGRVVILSILPGVFAAAIFADARQRRLFLRAVAVVGGVIGALLVSRGLTDGLSAVGLTLFSENRIVLGRALEVGCIAALAASNLTARRGIRWALVAMAALSGLATFFSASRGAVLALAVGVAVLFAFSLRTRRERWLVPLVAAVVGVVLFLTVPDSDLADRYLSLVTPGADVTIVQRSLLVSASIGTFVAAPLVGGGLGSFVYAFTPSALPATYAHNILLELLGETGLLGSVAVLAPLVVIAWMAVRQLLRGPDPELAGFLALFASMFAAAQLSGDLQINRHLFFFAGALWPMVVSPSAVRAGATAVRRPTLALDARRFT